MRGLLFLSVFASVLVNTQLEAQEFDLHNMQVAWYKNQQKVTSGHFEVTSKVTMPELSELDPFEDGVTKLSEREYQRKRTFKFQGSVLKVVDVGPNFFDVKSQRFETHTIESFNISSPGTSSHTWGQMYVVPLQQAFRMFDPQWYVFEDETASQVGGKFEQDGLMCYRLRLHSLDKKTGKVLNRHRIWTVCPSRDYAVVGYDVINENGTTTQSLKVSHKFDARLQIWIPENWTLERQQGQGKFIETSTVQKYEINVDIPERDLRPSLTQLR